MDGRHRRLPSADRFLTTISPSPPSTAATSDDGDELSEDDVFFAGADFSSPPSTSSTPLLIHHTKSFKSENFGILAALPESGDEPATSRSVFNHKALISPTSPSLSSSSSSPRPMIPVVPRPSAVASRQILSAPVNVPFFPVRERRHLKGSFFGDVDDENDEDEGEMLPPHEIVARKMAKSPVLSCSVLEGAGRTLKGRDLRQVRNAVFRQTGIRVLIKCDQVKKLSMATAGRSGAFETDLPSDAARFRASTAMNCLAKLLGGPNQLYALKKDMVSKIVMAQGDQNSYNIVTPLTFSKSCHGKCKLGIGSSKTIDLPIPPEYGLPPTSYYTPVLPIIGIP